MVSYHLDRLAGRFADAGAHMDPDQLLSTNQLANWVGRSAAWFEKLRLDGGGPRYLRISRRCIRYRLADVVDWLRERERIQTDGSRKIAPKRSSWSSSSTPSRLPPSK